MIESAWIYVSPLALIVIAVRYGCRKLKERYENKIDERIDYQSIEEHRSTWTS